MDIFLCEIYVTKTNVDKTWHIGSPVKIFVETVALAVISVWYNMDVSHFDALSALGDSSAQYLTRIVRREFHNHGVA